LAKYGIIRGMLIDVAKALADESRLRIIVALDGRELCVCQLTELLGLATSTVSRHISVLRQAGLLLSRKHGKWVFYALNRDARGADVQSAIGWVLAHRAALPQTGEYRRRLNLILKTDPEKLCRRQNSC
jgi:DNA-binding transcriptional ArsR family regulator